MNFLTKAFVVLVTFLSVLLVALLVPFVANTQNFRERIEDLEQAKEAAELRAEQQAAEISALESEQSQQVANLTAAKEELRSKVSDLQDQLDQVRAARRQLATENEQLKAGRVRLSTAVKQQGEIMEALQTELKNRRENMLEKQTRAIQLADRNNELQSQRESLKRKVRHLQEQMTRLEERNTELESKLARLPDDVRRRHIQKADAAGAERPSYMPQGPIHGQVTRVDTRDGQTFVQLNVGEQDGVERNMKFWVHRGDTFLGTVLVTAVEVDSAAGKVELSQGEIQQGDRILTGGI